MIKANLTFFKQRNTYKNDASQKVYLLLNDAQHKSYFFKQTNTYDNDVHNDVNCDFLT